MVLIGCSTLAAGCNACLVQEATETTCATRGCVLGRRWRGAPGCERSAGEERPGPDGWQPGTRGVPSNGGRRCGGPRYPTRLVVRQKESLLATKPAPVCSAILRSFGGRLIALRLSWPGRTGAMSRSCCTGPVQQKAGAKNAIRCLESKRNEKKLEFC